MNKLTGLISKGEAKASTPSTAPAPELPATPAPEVVATPAPAHEPESQPSAKPRKTPYYKALTLKVGYDEYMAIKRLCVEREATSQELLTEAVTEWLARNNSH